MGRVEVGVGDDLCNTSSSSTNAGVDVGEKDRRGGERAR